MTTLWAIAKSDKTIPIASEIVQDEASSNEEVFFSDLLTL